MTAAFNAPASHLAVARAPQSLLVGRHGLDPFPSPHALPTRSMTCGRTTGWWVTLSLVSFDRLVGVLLFAVSPIR